MTKYKFFGLTDDIGYGHPEKDTYTPTGTLLSLPTPRPHFARLVCVSVFYLAVVQKGCIFLKSHFLKDDDCLEREEKP